MLIDVASPGKCKGWAFADAWRPFHRPAKDASPMEFSAAAPHALHDHSPRREERTMSAAISWRRHRVVFQAVFQDFRLRQALAWAGSCYRSRAKNTRDNSHARV